MARTAILIIFALLILFLLPLSSSVNTHSRLSARNSTLPPRRAWLDTTAGILPDPASLQVTATEQEAPVAERRPEQQTNPAAQPVVEEAAMTGRTWRAARRRLDQLGVAQFRLETWGRPARYRFTCWVPLDENAFITRQFQATADDDLEAVWRVLEEVEGWLAKRHGQGTTPGQNH